MPKKTHESYSLFKKQTPSGKVWYVKFWDSISRRYGAVKSTGILVEGKRERRREAEEKARAMLSEIVFNRAPDVLFLDFIKYFWTPDSPYVREAALVKKRPLSAYYVHMNHEDVRLHIASFPPFQGVTLQKLTPALIRDWLTWMAGKGLSGSRINHVLLGMRVAVRYAVAREELDRDPFRNVGEAAETPKEKGVLTPAEVARLIAAPITDPRHRLAVLLGTLCGMRMGEVRGLQWGDISDGLIRIRHNWIDGEGVKAPKCKGGAVRENTRTVPLPPSVAAILETLRGINSAPDYFVFNSFTTSGEPVSKNYFRYVLDKELAAIGIPGTWKGKDAAPVDYTNEQKRRNLTFHGLRHTFVTVSRLAGITDLEIQALAGHRSGAMMENYTHAAAVLDFNSLRNKMNAAIEKGA